MPENHADVAELFMYIDQVLSSEASKVYVHCWGGVGRTGTIRRKTPETLEQEKFIADHVRIHDNVESIVN